MGWDFSYLIICSGLIFEFSVFFCRMGIVVNELKLLMKIKVSLFVFGIWFVTFVFIFYMLRGSRLFVEIRSERVLRSGVFIV